MIPNAPTYFVENPDESTEETLKKINAILGNREGYGRAIELILPEAMFYIQEKWTDIVTDNFKVKWIPVLKNNPILKEIPDCGPSAPETDPVEYNIGTTDDPVMVTRSSIRYDIVRDENAGFNRKMFSDLKELVPRFRFYVAKRNEDGNLEWTTVKVKTNEQLVEFTCSGRNQTESNFMYKCIEYIFYTNGRIFQDLGTQRHIRLGSPRRPSVNKDSKMHERVMSAYFRTEEYFYETPVIEITGMDYDWDDISIGFDDPYDVGMLPGT